MDQTNSPAKTAEETGNGADLADIHCLKIQADSVTQDKMLKFWILLRQRADVRK